MLFNNGIKKALFKYADSVKLKMQIRYTVTVLGIETSCDDTACAIVNSNRKILGESIRSQSVVHLRYGGINPIIAQELHREHIDSVVKDALRESSLQMDAIDAVAVTVKPGLLASLLVGVKYANYMTKTYNKPFIPIHHMKAHALVARMYNSISFPFLVLLISGGHCLLAVVKGVDEFMLLGESLDDSPGEAFDKVARRMKLRNIPEYSKLAGGQAVEIAASKAISSKMFDFPTPLVRSRDCNFSFSGLKESLNRKLKKKEKEHNIQGDGVIPEVNELCASFLLAVSEHLVHRTHRAIKFSLNNGLIDHNNKCLVVSGGVACNNYIFKSLETLGSTTGFNVYRPPQHVCTDNGIMIAWNGIEKFRKNTSFSSYFDLNKIMPKASLGASLVNEVKESSLSVKVTRIQ